MPHSERNNPMLVKYTGSGHWRNCLDDLKYTYTLTLKDMCKILKCSRSWATRYLKPHLHYIYVGNGYRKAPIRGVNYIAKAREELERPNMTETTWYSETEFYDLIRSHLEQCTRQTIIVPIERLIDPFALDIFKKKYKELNQIISEYNECKYSKSYSDENMDLYLQALEDRDRLIASSLKSKYKAAYYDVPIYSKRSESPAVPFPMDFSDFDLNNLLAVHDIKDYGDVDESIYRRLFLDGCIRTVLRLPDKYGEISEKIYYIQPEPEDEFPDFPNSLRNLLVKYCKFKK